MKRSPLGSGLSPRVVFRLACAALLVGAVPAFAYVTQGNQWSTSDGPVEYWVAAAGSDDLADGGEVAAIDRAFRTWECVPCSTVQFRNMGTGPNAVTMDGKNNVVFVERRNTLQQLLGADPDTMLATNINFDPDVHPYFEQDVVFNGTTFHGDRIIWTNNPADPVPDAGVVELDLESVMLQQVGYFLGMDTNCTPPGSDSCASIGQSIMAPVYAGVNRTLRQDDMDGVCSIYPGTKTSCDLRRLRESCERDCDCDPGLVCVPDGDGRMCSKTCLADTPTCPAQTGCVLLPGGTDGLCMRRSESNLKLDGMVCSRSAECESNDCTRGPAIGKLVCTRACTTDDDCNGGYTCQDSLCLTSAAGETVPCPEDNPPAPPPAKKDDDKGCQQSGPSVGGLCLAGWLFWRRRATR